MQAFIEEFAPEHVTVVVDATFPNRIDRKERKTYEDAVNANELITPPAGAIGRGDAFILQIARQANAAILSNDSFQEFHGEFPWLFERVASSAASRCPTSVGCSWTGHPCGVPPAGGP